MTANEIKEYVIENELVEDVLKSIQCHDIVHHQNYWTCANKDGDNKQAIVVYDETLSCVNYTRTMSKSKKATDIFDLVMFNEGLTFPESLKFVCAQFGLDFYQPIRSVPESITILQMLHKTMMGVSNDLSSEPAQLKPIPEKVLDYYLPFGNLPFEKDGISLDVQREFGIGYDPLSNRATIPIRDSVGTLVGVKGRTIEDTDGISKYMYLEKCSKGQLLYGFYENRAFIKRSKYLYVFESEKGVLQAASYGFRNCVATGGKNISSVQVELIVRSCCIPIIAFDKDVAYEELEDIAAKFNGVIDVYAIYDKESVLKEKESPTDKQEAFLKLKKDNVYLVADRKVS